MPEQLNDPAKGSDTQADEMTLMSVIARKYFIGRQSKSEIAEQLYISRFKVARLLEAAQDLGVVNFSIGLPGDTNHNLAEELKKGNRLKHAVVVDDHADSVEQFRLLGHAVVKLLGDVVQPGDQVGISSTRSLMGLGALTTPLSQAHFVQLNGSLSRPDAMDIIDGIRRLTAQARGTANVFYAPMLAESEEASSYYLGQAEVRKAFARFSQLMVAVTGVGAWAPGLSVSYDNLPADGREAASQAGAVAEVLGVPVDRSGRTVECEVRRRIVAPNAEILRSVPISIGVVLGEEKADAVHTVVKAGLINSIVTHRSVAERLVSK